MKQLLIHRQMAFICHTTKKIIYNNFVSKTNSWNELEVNRQQHKNEILEENCML